VLASFVTNLQASSVVRHNLIAALLYLVEDTNNRFIIPR
jgi:hypothetical protein